MSEQDVTLDPKQHRRATPPVATVRVLFSGSDAVVPPPRVVLGDGPTEVGRTVEGPLCLAGDRRASRRHAVLHVETRAGLARVVDHSRHGTLLNGARVSEQPLSDGDVLRLGDSFLLFRWDEEEARDVEVEGIVGVAPALRRVRVTLGLVAPTQNPVLLLGESGVGKEVAARAVHELSGRRGRFVAVNCAAIPEHLAESQLFGHKKGAFTGATDDSPGFFRSAEGGTLFLDEIGELPEPLQAKLLRALEERCVQPVGAPKAVPVDVRVVSATNRDLLLAARKGGFRGDLYARLAGIVIRLAPLRERREDVLALLLHYLPRGAPPISAELVDRLLLYPWPFNIRELQKVAAELELLGRGAELLEPHLVEERLRAPDDDDDDDGPGPASPSGEPRSQHMPPRDEVEALLRAHRGVVSAAARAAGRSRRQLYRWLERYGIDAEAFREGP